MMQQSCLNMQVSQRQRKIFIDHRSYSILVLITNFWATISTTVRMTFLSFVLCVSFPNARASWCRFLVPQMKRSLNCCVSIILCNPKYALSFLWLRKSRRWHFLEFTDAFSQLLYSSRFLPNLIILYSFLKKFRKSKTNWRKRDWDMLPLCHYSHSSPHKTLKIVTCRKNRTQSNLSQKIISILHSKTLKTCLDMIHMRFSGKC